MRARTVAVVSVVLFAGLAGCVDDINPGSNRRTPGEDVRGPEEDEDGQLPFQTLAKGEHSGVTDRHTVVIRDQGTWDQWEDTVNASDRAENVSVDFDTEMVVAVYYGNATNTCRGAVVQEIGADGAEREIEVEGAFFTLYGPGADCQPTNTTPYHVVKLGAFAGNVSFDMDVVSLFQANGDTDMTNGNGSNETRPSWHTLAEGQRSSVAERETVVVRTQEAYEELWQRHTRNETDPPARPEADLADGLVVGVFKGDSPNACHGATITDVSRAPNGTLMVEGAWFERQAFCAQFVTQPFHLVQVNATADEVVFAMESLDHVPGQGANGGDGENETRGDGGTPLNVTNIGLGLDSNETERGLFVVRNQSQWERLWSNHTGPAFNPPQVDFSNETVLAAFRGTAPNDCHGAEFTNVTLTEHGALMAEGVWFFDEGGCAGGDRVTPYHIVSVNATGHGVAFAFEDERGDGEEG